MSKKEQRGSALADISALWQQTMDQINGNEIPEIFHPYLILRRSGKIPKGIELQR